MIGNRMVTPGSDLLPDSPNLDAKVPYRLCHRMSLNDLNLPHSIKGFVNANLPSNKRGSLSKSVLIQSC